MLRHLYIKNYALIDELDIDFDEGFSVITGETGAGKSIILGALGLLLGERADLKSIKGGTDKCVIEARFDIPHGGLEEYFRESDLVYDRDMCIMRRELYASGRSRAFVNDSPVRLEQARVVGGMLIDIHSQHKNLLLNNEAFQREVLDILAGDNQLLSDYRRKYTAYNKQAEEVARLRSQALQEKKDEDYIRFQLSQLEEAAVEVGETERLEREQSSLEHAGEIKTALYGASSLLEGSDEYPGIITSLSDCVSALQAVRKVSSEAEDWMKRAESSRIELEDILHDINQRVDNVEYDPERSRTVEERLDTIYSLQQKHGVQTDEELQAVMDDYAERLSLITNSDDRLEEMEKKLKNILAEVMTTATQLTKARSRAARTVEEKMCGYLVPLGIPNVRFVVEITTSDTPGEYGADKIRFLFTANKNSPLRDISDVASGGEIARVMLSLKAMIAGAVSLPTIIFDEIDTGVSGRVADKMADIMSHMGTDGRQVMSITHLPQIASRGTSHYKVFKEDTPEGTRTSITKLTPEERVTEIAHILSGAKLTEAALENARELLKIQ